MHKINEVKMPEKIARPANLENYKNALYQNLGRMEKMGLCTETEKIRLIREDKSSPCCGDRMNLHGFCENCWAHC